MKLNHLERLFFSASNLIKTEKNLNTVSLPGLQLLKKYKRKMSGEPVKSGLPLDTVVKELNKFADLSLAEKWDNVGLLIEPMKERPIDSILLTNDLTESVMEESINKKISLIISYHPPIFAPLKRITKSSWKERIVANCIENRIAVFSPHTSWDAVDGGVNDWLSDAFEDYIKPDGRLPLVPCKNDDESLYITNIIGQPEAIDNIREGSIELSRSKWHDKDMYTTIYDKKALQYIKLVKDINVATLESEKTGKTMCGMGRILEVSKLTLGDCVRLIKSHTGLPHVRLACGQKQTEASTVSTIALCAGSGGSLLKGVKADLFLTGEMFHHDILDAAHNGTSVILTNHSDSERGFLTKMAFKLKVIFQDKIKIDVSFKDSDPLKTV